MPLGVAAPFLPDFITRHKTGPVIRNLQVDLSPFAGKKKKGNMWKSRGLMKGLKFLRLPPSSREHVILGFNASPSVRGACQCTDVAMRPRGISGRAFGRNLDLPKISSIPSIGHLRDLYTSSSQGEQISMKTVVEHDRQVMIERKGVSESHKSFGDNVTEIFDGNKSSSLQNKDPRKRVGLKSRTSLLIDILLNLKDSKEAVYGALDSWVAWEQNFPLVALKRALHVLEKKEQWHRIIQVIKWILSKGQATTLGTYEQLIRALDKDRRAEEAHTFWEKRIGSNLHSVSWQLCTLMIYIYSRNSMPERLIKLFKDLEMYNRKPPDKAVVKKVADAYELLGLQEEQEKLLQKYGSLFKSSSSTTGKGKQESSSNSHKESKPPFGNAPKNYDAGNDSIATAKTMPTLGSCSTTT